jgi:hypothetical protein
MLTPPHPVALIEVGEPGGRLLGERGYFVPAPLFDAWIDAGAYEGAGDPLMPAVPFTDGVLQCFARVCFRFDGTGVTRLPLGELLLIGESGLRPCAPWTSDRSSSFQRQDTHCVAHLWKRGRQMAE